MTSRFASNLLFAVLGATLATMSFAFAPPVVGWLALSFGCAAVAATLAAFAWRGRGPFQRVIDVIVVLLGAWTIVASRSFSGQTERWLSLGEAACLFGLAVIGLIGHEVIVESTQRRREPVAADNGQRDVKQRDGAVRQSVPLPSDDGDW